MSGCTFSGNSAFEGGAIDNAAISGNATLSVINSTFSGNSASNNACGIANGAFGGPTASLTLINCTLSGNSATSQGTNLNNDNGGGFLTGSGDLNNTDPMLEPLQDNGGPTFTHALLTGSPRSMAGATRSGRPGWTNAVTSASASAILARSNSAVDRSG